MTTTASLEQRVGHLEVACGHLTTGADPYRRESRLLRWAVGTILASMGIAAGVASGITLAVNLLLGD